MIIYRSLQYLLARGIPGLINFAALAIYTRLLTAEEFGRYALVLSIVGLGYVAGFQWLVLVLGRFVPRSMDRPGPVLKSVLALFLTSASVVVVGAVIGALLGSTQSMAWLIMLAAALVVAQAWHELNLAFASARIEPVRYGYQLGTKAGLSLLIGASLAWFGWGTAAPIVGLILGSLSACWLLSAGAWRCNRPRWPSPATLAEYGAYGLPLAITFALVWLTSSADRLIIAWLIDESATGYYAVGYDLAQQSLGLLLTIVNTAATPLAIRSLETDGVDAAAEQMRHNGELMIAVAMAGAAGLIAVGPLVIDLFVGAEFRAGARLVFPWIAVTAAVIGIKSFHFDIAFHLTRQSRWLMLTSGLAAALGIVLNFLLIPRYGIVGSAWASLGGFSLAAGASALLGRRVFPMPKAMPLLFKGFAVAVPTYLCAHWATGWAVRADVQLALALSVGAVTAIAACLILDTARLRAALKSGFLRQRSS